MTTEEIKQIKETGIFQLAYSKADNPATGKQINYVIALASKVSVSKSQIMKRLEFDEASALIDLHNEGISFEITE